MVGDGQKLSKLFSYLKDFAVLKERRTRKYQIDDVDFNVDFDDLNQDNPYLTLCFEAESLADNHPVFTIVRPDAIECPEPSEGLQEWLINDWEDHHVEEIQVKKEIIEDDERIQFSDTSFAHEFDKWILKREVWREKSIEIEEAQNIFDAFYRFYQQTNLQQDTHELYLGSHYLKSLDGSVDYPFVLRPAKIIYDISSKELKFIASENGSKIQRFLLDQITGLDLKDFKTINEEFELLDPHPFDREALAQFMKPLLNSLTPFSKYLDREQYLNFKKQDEKIIIYERNSMLFTSRSNAKVQYLETAVESIEKEHYPDHLVSFVNFSRKQNIKPAEEAKGLERLANLGGESLDVLLAKEANEEQLNIIKRLQQGHDGVLVQGPPGTGKTHTIANITGHFLSEGKTVLITSTSHKALSVLKDKLPKPIQALAVSLLDNDREDMENSIDKINEKVSSTNILSLEKRIQRLEKERVNLMEELGSYREKILAIKVKESESVVVAGKSMTLTQLARFISENESTLNIIPGKVIESDELPLSMQELEELYLTNLSLSEEEEKEFVLGLVDPDNLISPEEFREILSAQNKISTALKQMEEHSNEEYEFLEESLSVRIRRRGYPFLIKGFNEEIEYELAQFLEGLEGLEEWSKNAIIAGKKAGNHLNVWDELKTSIRIADEKENEYVDKLFAKEIDYNGSLSLEELRQLLPEMVQKHGTLGFGISKMINKKYKDVLSHFTLNGRPVSNKEDLELVFYSVDLKYHEEKLMRYWNALIGDFESIEAAYNSLEEIDYYLGWATRYEEFKNKMTETGVRMEYLFDSSMEKTVEGKLNKIMDDFQSYGLALHQVLQSILDLNRLVPEFENSFEILKKESSSHYNNRMIQALNEKDVEKYKLLFSEVSQTYHKSVVANQRESMLTKLQKAAPAWALAIRERKGIHGYEHVPSQIEEAWRFKQYARIIDEVLNYNYNEILDLSYRTGQKFRETTAELAAEKAWYALIMRTKEDRELQNILNTWKMYMGLIGKGTGKRAARYRRHARELMKDAQRAIPTWIMPMDQVVNNMTPGLNQFDVVIVDEASQADITDLACLFLGEKVIVVGDDRQVSPSSFLRDDEIQSLKQTYFEKEEMKYFDILGGETSLYDLAGNVYESLMLKEHFRCVPEIIDFSSFDSYDGQISALRGGNTAQVFPALVEYRVDNGQYEDRGRSNQAEAQAIGAIIYGMTKTPAYDGLSIGVITMLSSPKHEELILREISKHISPDEMEKRKIVVGRSSSFQGDERDVMILSLVQSNEKDTPLPLHGVGRNDSRKKIYNVAVSRARDQLWVVHSLDLEKDLKHGDYRRKLIEHVRNPYFKEEKIESLSDSPFEEEVAKALIGRGYKIEQQKPVGTFRIDMVAYGSNEQVAIECDGERYHSGQDKILEDLERQTVLERIGWKFIRLRGSEYYRDKEKAIDRVCNDLNELGIEPIGDKEDYFEQKMNVYTAELNQVLDHTAKVLKEDPQKLKKKSLPFYDPKIDDKKSVEDQTLLQKDLKKMVEKKEHDSETTVENHVSLQHDSEKLSDSKNPIKSTIESKVEDDKKASNIQPKDKDVQVKEKDAKNEHLKNKNKEVLKHQKEVKKDSKSDKPLLNKKEASKSDGKMIKMDEGYYRYSSEYLSELEYNLSRTKYTIGIVDHLGLVSEPSLWNIELNLVTWNSQSVVYDLRRWQNDHKVVGKGVTMSPKELKELNKILKEVIREEGKV